MFLSVRQGKHLGPDHALRLTSLEPAQTVCAPASALDAPNSLQLGLLCVWHT